MDRAAAWNLLCEFVTSDSLRKHCLAVEACMRSYAERSGAPVDTWGLAGLLHDFDYERWQTPPDHTRQGAAILRERGVDEEVVGAILSHAEWNLADYPRDTPLRKTLFAVDELAGFIVACALVRPTRIVGLEPKSVLKKMKTPAFAAAVSRADIQAGAELLGLPVDQHISNCIKALEAASLDLGIRAPV